MVWDLPTRLFHWSFVICIIGAYVSGERGAMTAHEYFGLAAFGLVVFRLIWGFIGHETARFSHFLPTPLVLWDYIKGLKNRPKNRPVSGHNPTGALATMALLSIMGGMGATGLWTGDDVLYDAPLTAAGLAPHLAAPMGAWHQSLHVAVLPLIGLHVLAIAVHRFWLGEKLLHRMVSGGKTGPLPDPRRTRRGLILLGLCLGGSLSLSWLTPNFV